MAKKIKFNEFVNDYIKNPDRWHLFPNHVKYVNKPMSEWGKFEVCWLEKYMEQARGVNIDLMTAPCLNAFLDKYGERETYEFSFIDYLRYKWFYVNELKKVG